MTTHEQIEAMIAAKQAERQGKGLKITILREDGTEFTCYPKDEATKKRWLAGYKKKGITVCASS